MTSFRWLALSVLLALPCGACLSSLDADRLDPRDVGTDVDAADDVAPPEDGQADEGGAETDTGCLSQGTDDCDGVDDDCDDLTDEHYGRAGEACDGDDADLCEEGQMACVGGREVCVDTSGDSYEVCNEVDDDCDGSTDEGFDLQNDMHNCGACGVRCDLPNLANPECFDGSCTSDGCEPGYADCWEDPGCEVYVWDDAYCGSDCGDLVDCTSPPDYSARRGRCDEGTCEVSECRAGRAECNGVWDDGCELDITTAAPACGVAPTLGPIAGDAAGAPVTAEGSGNGRVRVLVEETSTAAVPLTVLVQLEVGNVNYELHVDSGVCPTAGPAASAHLGSVDESLEVAWNHSGVLHSRRTLVVDVVFRDGGDWEGCGVWTLTVQGNAGSGYWNFDDLPDDGCADGIDNDGDGWTDLDDSDCGWHAGAAYGFERGIRGVYECNNGLDDDHSAGTDASDSNCLSGWDDCEGSTCPWYPGLCGDWTDNDGDGWTDRDDPDCRLAPYYVEMGGSYYECNNGRDDDGDDLIDAADPDCTSAESDE